MALTPSRRSVLRALALAPVAALAGRGLGGSPPTVRAAAGDPPIELVTDQVTTGGTPLWQGFDHRWQNHPHRVNRFGSWLHNFDVSIGAQPGVAFIGGDYAAHMQYGDTNGGDVATTAAYVAPLMITDQPGDLTCLHARATVVFTAMRGTRSFLQGDPIELLLPANVAAAVVLRGFNIVCVNAPTEGFHTRGFGFRIHNLTLTPVTDPRSIQRTRLSFQPEFMIWPERSPDPFNQGPTGYQYRLTLFYTVLWAPAGRLRVTQAGFATPMQDGDEYSPPQRVLLSVTGQGGNAFPRSAWAMHGFRFELGDWPATEWDGRYLRQLRFFVEPASYDPQTGLAAYYANAWFTNEGFAYRFKIAYALDATLIQFASPIGSAPRRLEQTIDPHVNALGIQRFSLGGYLAGLPGS